MAIIIIWEAEALHLHSWVYPKKYSNDDNDDGDKGK